MIDYNFQHKKTMKCEENPAECKCQQKKCNFYNLLGKVLLLKKKYGEQVQMCGKSLKFRQHQSKDPFHWGVQNRTAFSNALVQCPAHLGWVLHQLNHCNTVICWKVANILLITAPSHDQCYLIKISLPDIAQRKRFHICVFAVVTVCNETETEGTPIPFCCDVRGSGTFLLFAC